MRISRMMMKFRLTETLTMDRKNFFKSACGLGVCSCIGLGLLSSGKSNAAGTQESDPKDRFVKNRFAKLIGILDSTLDEETRNKIIEDLGRECAKDGSISARFVNNPEGFFDEIHTRWGEKFTYNKEKGFIRIETPERDCV